jgi:hypothetical protein
LEKQSNLSLAQGASRLFGDFASVDNIEMIRAQENEITQAVEATAEVAN